MIHLPANLSDRFVLSGVTSPRGVLRNGQEVDWTALNEETAEFIVTRNLSDQLHRKPEPPAENSEVGKKTGTSKNK
jgi:hypothetical protein